MEVSEHAQTAQNGLEGLVRVREAAEQGLLPQLILVDINMPVMDGFEILQEPAKLELNLSDTKLVLVSSSKNPLDMERAAESSANSFSISDAR